MKNEQFYIEVKSDSVNDKGEFIGYGSIYGNVDLGGDVVVKGAFTKSLTKRGNSVPMLWQHDFRIPIGKFLLEDDEKGLVVKGFINLETEKGREALALLKQGAIKGLSIGYRTLDSEYTKEARLLKELDLLEVSIVTFPMNVDAEVDLATVKSEVVDDIQEPIDEAKNEPEEENKNNQELVALVDKINKFVSEISTERKLKEIREYFKKH